MEKNVNNDADADVQQMLAMAQPPTNEGSIEDSLAKELLNLSLTDRNAMEEEIHGVRCLALVEESSELLMRSLKEFDHEVMLIKNANKMMKQSIVNFDNDIYGTHGALYGDYIVGDYNNNNEVDDNDVLRNVIPISSSLDEATITTTVAIPESATDPDPSLCYVNDPRVRLRFLRTELFDAKKAARRFVNYLLFTKKLFGNYIADRPIQVSDFQAGDELRALKESRVQILPFRDRSGRRILAGVEQANYDLKPLLRYKIFMYMAWIASENVETQQKGLVRIAWPCDTVLATSSSHQHSSDSDTTKSTDVSASSWERSIRPAITKLDIEYQKLNYAALPLRCVAIHFCGQDTPIYRLLGSLYYFAVSKSAKSRTKFHFGEMIENRYKLQSYGIPIDLLPLTHTGTVKLSYHSKWVTYRQTLELEQQERREILLQQLLQQQQQQNLTNNNSYNTYTGRQLSQSPASASEAGTVVTNNNDGDNNINKKKKRKKRNKLECHIYDIVDCPRSNDIIFRKGKNYLNNPGNVYFRQLIESTNTEHAMLEKRTDKVTMTWRIYQQLEQTQTQRNGRFLDRDRTYNVWYIQKDRNTIREKIANTYREYNRSCKEKEKQIQMTHQHTQQYTQQYTQPQPQPQPQRMITYNDNVVHSKRRKVMTTATATANSNTSIATGNTAPASSWTTAIGMMSSNNNKSCFGIYCGGGSGGDVDVDESFESLFSDL